MARSKVLEGYCADIEHLLREGSLREAVRLAVALPEICVSLESPRLLSSHEDYVRWCQRWLKLEEHGSKPVTGARVFRLHALHTPPRSVGAKSEPRPAAIVRFRMRRHARTYRSLGRARVWQPASPLETFQVNLSEALIAAARAWYEHARQDGTVVKNLGKLALR